MTRARAPRDAGADKALHARLGDSPRAPRAPRHHAAEPHRVRGWSAGRAARAELLSLLSLYALLPPPRTLPLFPFRRELARSRVSAAAPGYHMRAARGSLRPRLSICARPSALPVLRASSSCVSPNN